MDVSRLFFASVSGLCFHRVLLPVGFSVCFELRETSINLIFKMSVAWHFRTALWLSLMLIKPSPKFQILIFSLLDEKGGISHPVPFFWKLNLDCCREITRVRRKNKKQPTHMNLLKHLFFFPQGVKRWFQLQRDSLYIDLLMFLRFLWNVLQILLVEKLLRWVDNIINNYLCWPFQGLTVQQLHGSFITWFSKFFQHLLVE